MGDTLHERIVTARESVHLAESRLRRAIEEQGNVARAQKVEASVELRAALSKLKAARAKLDHLEDALSAAEVEAARQSVLEAVAVLNRAIGDVHPASRAEKAWVSGAVMSALEAARTARVHVTELEAALKLGG